jgi:hypothetical protein
MTNSKQSLSVEELGPRQLQPSLLAALDEAGRHFRSQARAYRAPQLAFGHKGHMDKNVRRAMAASMDDYARLIEDHAAALRSRSPLEDNSNG